MLDQLDDAVASLARIAHPDLRQRVWLAAVAAMRGNGPTVIRELDAVARIAPDWDHLTNMRIGYYYEHEEDTRRMLQAVELALKIWRGES
jgi:hypothetical protein